MAWRSNKKGLAVVGLFLFLMGVAVPAAFGLLTEKAMGLGVGDLLDKSTNWDSSNIANSTYFTDKVVRFFDNQTGKIYLQDIVYDDASSLDLSMFDASGSIVSSSTGASDSFSVRAYMNKTAVLNDVDKIVFLFKISDAASVDLTKLQLRVRLCDTSYSTCVFDEVYNATEAYNNTLRVEITIDAIRRLKLESSTTDTLVLLTDSVAVGGMDLNNMIVGYCVELYDVKKVNATAASNIMLAVSGVLGWLGALAATPYWNPYANREHRNIRGAYKKVRGKIRVPRRRR